MHEKTDPRNPDLNLQDRIHGYQIEKRTELPEINAFYYELVHPESGARHIHISHPDEENAFAVMLKTVPKDDSGVAHILEHTVLCGSEKYPVRDPFFSMMKRSLNTFMNALTASDWTMYPFATQNKKDFYNLMSVYLDAVFFPKLDRLSFKQEGHRLEIDPDGNPSGEGRLVFKGVVYNEMKGAMSSPDQIMGHALLNALYPDTTYSYNSGGDPAKIPDLTHEQLILFHQRHYHPSNAYFYTYGHLPLFSHLAFIEENILSRFKRISPDTDVASQPHWTQPRTATYFYPIDRSENSTRKCQFCVAWLTADIRDSFDVLVLSVLEQVLIGNSGSPLRKALMDSGLGSTLSDGSGYNSENKDTMFCCGLKDVAENDADAIEQIIYDTFTDLSRNGIDRRLVDSAIHQIEFHRKEVTNTPYPYGLKLLLRFCGDWLHDGDPAAILEFDALLDRFFRELDSGLLEDRIRSFFIDNPHRVRLLLKPDVEMAEKMAKTETERLENIQRQATRQDLESLSADAAALMRLQESDEDVSFLPTLELTDIYPDIRFVNAPRSVSTPAMDCYTQPTSGIFYFTAAVGLQGLPPDLVPLVPFFCYAMPRTGTQTCDYVEVSRRIDQFTGGMGFSANAATRFSDPSAACIPMLSFSGKCLSRNIEKMFDIFKTLVCEYSFSDLPRLKSLLLECRSDMESAVVHNGHRLAISLAARNFSDANALNETWHGVHQLKLMKQLTEDINEERLQSLSADLCRIAAILFFQQNFKTALIGEPSDIDTAEAQVRSFLSGLEKNDPGDFNAPAIKRSQMMPYEGWSTATAVSFVAKAFETRRMNHPDAPVLAVISKLLKTKFLHREIREKGGAYGGFSMYQLENGLFYYGSYRDPHIVNTLWVYEAAADFIQNGAYTDEDIKEAILMVCADFDHPDSPGPAATKAFYRKLIGLTDELRRSFKANLLQVTRDRVLSAAKNYFGTNQGPAAIAVISNDDKLAAANPRLKSGPLSIHRI